MLKVLVIFLQSTEADIDQEVAKLDQSEPFVVVTGKPGTSTSQFYIYCESSFRVESKSLRDAIIDVMMQTSWHVMTTNKLGILKKVV